VRCSLRKGVGLEKQTQWRGLAAASRLGVIDDTSYIVCVQTWRQYVFKKREWRTRAIFPKTLKKNNLVGRREVLLFTFDEISLISLHTRANQRACTFVCSSWIYWDHPFARCKVPCKAFHSRKYSCRC
jgi:hypothetical protein